MGVIAVQAVIVVSFCICRLIAARRMPMLAVGWSALTLFLVFMPWLMALQLAVIWTTFTLLRPSHIEGANGDDFPAARPPLASPAEKLASAGSEFSQGIAKLNEQLERKRAIRVSLTPIELAIYAERTWINGASSAAQRAVRVAAFIGDSPERSESFARHYAKLAAELDRADQPPHEQPMEVCRLPDFAEAKRRTYGSITLDVLSELDRLERQRRTDLRAALKAVPSDPTAHQAFWGFLAENGQPLIHDGLRKFAQEEGLLAEAKKTNLRASALTVLAESEPPTTVALPAQVARVAIRARVMELAIPYLVHFTRIDQLDSILSNGICPPSVLRERNLPYIANDPIRYDRQNGASSFSIAHPNHKLFWRWRQENPEVEWVVLMIDPEVLWTHEVAFCARNAALRSVSSTSLDERRTLAALNAMYSQPEDLPLRDAQMLRTYDPTDVQAEVLIFDIVPPSSIVGARFASSAALERFKGCLHGDLAMDTAGRGAFGTREYVRRNRGTI